MKIDKFKMKYYKDFKRIYLSSFKKEDRFANFKLLLNLALKRTNMYVAILEDEVVAFIYIINDERKRFILYLAVKEKCRNIKIGTNLLNWYLNNNKDKDIFLNIDEVSDKFDDSIDRKRRLDFYQKNGFYLTDYLSVNEDFKGNVLSNKKEFNIDEYKLLDKKIARMFWCKCDKMEKLK